MLPYPESNIFHNGVNITSLDVQPISTFFAFGLHSYLFALFRNSIFILIITNFLQNKFLEFLILIYFFFNCKNKTRILL